MRPRTQRSKLLAGRLLTVATCAFGGLFGGLGCAASYSASWRTEVRAGGQAAAVPELRRPRLRLCSFNVLRLGFENEKDYALLAALIRDHCDGVALLEVMLKRGDSPGLTQLLTELGPAWASQRTVTAKPEGSTRYAEFYAFAWNSAELRSCATFDKLQYLDDPNDDFLREPAFGCFSTADGHFDFLLVLYHANYDRSRARVQEEVRNLDGALAQLERHCPAERDLLVFGDFNLRPPDLMELTKFQVATEGDGSTLGPAGNRTRNRYDNLLLPSPPPRPELEQVAQILDVRAEAGGEDAYRKHISDHLPLQLLLDRPARDDDPPCLQLASPLTRAAGGAKEIQGGVLSARSR